MISEFFRQRLKLPQFYTINTYRSKKTFLLLVLRHILRKVHILHGRMRTMHAFFFRFFLLFLIFDVFMHA